MKKLYEARYRALSADIMGNTYEQYLGKTLAQRDGDGRHRRQPGNAQEAGQLLHAAGHRPLPGGQLAGPLPVRHGERPAGRRAAARRAAQDRRGDPRPARAGSAPAAAALSCIYAYEVLADFYRSEIERLERERDRRHQELMQQGITTPLDIRIELTPWTAEIERLQSFPA